jgi:hypothetical protein
MAAEGPRKGDPSTRIVRYGLTTQPALSVRGSSRRIMFLRFRPAYISMINRRASSSAVIGPAVPGKKLKAHQRGRVPTRAAHRSLFAVPERCSQARVRYAAPNTGAPLPAPRRSGLITLRWAAPAGTLHGLAEQNKKRKGKKHISTPNSLTRSLHISSRLERGSRGQRRPCQREPFGTAAGGRVSPGERCTVMELGSRPRRSRSLDH